MCFPPLANEYMVRYTFFDKSIFMGFDYFIFIHPISQTFTTYWWSEVLFSKRNCSEKSNQILEIRITYVKVKKRFQRKMWKIIIHFSYLCLCVMRGHYLYTFLKVPLDNIIMCSNCSFQVLLICSNSFAISGLTQFWNEAKNCKCKKNKQCHITEIIHGPFETYLLLTYCDTQHTSRLVCEHTNLIFKTFIGFSNEILLDQ